MGARKPFMPFREKFIGFLQNQKCNMRNDNWDKGAGTPPECGAFFDLANRWCRLGSTTGYKLKSLRDVGKSVSLHFLVVELLFWKVVLSKLIALIRRYARLGAGLRSE
jgi:hypothetical protein